MSIYRNLEKLQKEQEKARKKQEGVSTPSGFQMPPEMKSMMSSIKGMANSSGSFKIPR